METQMTKSYGITAGITTAFYLVISYGVASIIWAFALEGRLLWFACVGAAIGLLIGFISGVVIANQRSEERAKEMGFAAFSIWVPLAALIGILGLVVLVIRAL